jgi:hypothetical protein
VSRPRKKATKLGRGARRIFDVFMGGERLTGLDMTGKPYCSAHGASRVNEMTALGIKVTKTPETRQGVHGQVRVVVYSIEPEDRAAARAIVAALGSESSPGERTIAPTPTAPVQVSMFGDTATHDVGGGH